MIRRWNMLISVVFTVVMTASLALAKDAPPVSPSSGEKCPVCGMFVAKYPDWVGEIIYSDGKTVFFDGAKDLFKYYFNIQKYHPRKSLDDISAIYVTDYYDVSLINAHDAYFVLGSDVYGPMGRELIPLKTEGDANEFSKDHKGKLKVQFSDVTPQLILTLD
ncbi:nitrous oxide reductase accessory protein NosL [Desulfoluna limicola]|uniref:Nitrous oxide reductase accessory protein NosL n=1 Tax=Desulfoluna limicola TaxID=2810562 RepID=A0ABN6FAA6_9BACT|nr:nitrous oxide reductase accessory protein NosL [Desulfoluna limicola]BCS98755.1 nitrous oxide reductase accessory protein NosL [Desulfoluna limicola]